jgi:hypothetical protein
MMKQERIKMATKVKSKKSPAKKGEVNKLAIKSRKKPRGKPFKKGNKANPDGRPKGSKNYKTLVFEERLESLKCDPVKVLADICNDENEEKNLRLTAAKELVSYVYPKRKAIELEHKGDSDLESALAKAHERVKQARDNGND